MGLKRDIYWAKCVRKLIRGLTEVMLGYLV